MNTLSCLETFNQIYKEMDIVYHDYAKACGLSNMAYWILYSVAESDEYFTQRDFCNNWFFAPQTVNSALKDLEKKDIIYLEPAPDNRKNKLIKPTENGKNLIERIIMPLIQVECESFHSLSEEECKQMLATTKKYVSALREKVTLLTAE